MRRNLRSLVRYQVPRLFCLRLLHLPTVSTRRSQHQSSHFLPPSPPSLLNRKNHADQLRTLSRAVETEDVESLDQETERKAGWVFKAIAIATFTYMGLNVYPLMGNNSYLIYMNVPFCHLFTGPS